MKREILIVILLFMLPVVKALSQRSKDRIHVKKGLQVVLRDTTFITKRDTLIYLNERDAAKIKIRENPYSKSSKFYDTLAEKSSSSKITKDIFDLVVKKKGRKETLVSVILKSEEVFKPYAGYRISSITFKYVDLLEGSVVDTLQKASTRFGKFVNKVHRDTRAVVIKQNLLFKVGDVVDPYRMADNERILRQFKTLRDARIYLTPNKDNAHEVDVIVVTQDVASIGISGAFGSMNKFRFDLYDINIMGYAKQLQISYFRSTTDHPQNGYEITLREQNLFKSFIQGEVEYTDNYIRERTRLSLGRDFFTPDINYAGGIDLFHTRENFYFEDYDTLKVPYTENNADVWFGRSFEYTKRTNIIFSARVNTIDFTERPFISQDSNSFFYNRTLILGSVTLAKRNFLKSLRVRGFGKTEDIPTGATATLIGGQETNQFTDRSYFEVDGTVGHYFENIGYVNAALAIGSYFKSRVAEDGIISLTGTYFSDLKRVRKSQLRQFVYFTYIKGIDRKFDKTLILDRKWENKQKLSPFGNEKMAIGLETVYFMPWYFYGFRFALFHRFDLNLITLNKSLVDKESVFPTIRAGVRTLNENLVLPSLSLEMAYYGKNADYGAAWEIKFLTKLPLLFGTQQIFKPQVTVFQ